MFERFTQEARRTIFVARYEASNFGSPFIETEHLLLGILQETHRLAKWFPGDSDVGAEVRAEIEKRMFRKERISTSVEIPLSQEGKKVLTLAMETADRLGHDQIDLEHMLIGILRIEGSPAAQILIARGIKPEVIQEQIGKGTRPKRKHEDTAGASKTLENFLSGLKSLSSGELIEFFAKNGQFIDAVGKRWDRNEISKGFETLFAPYAKKNASYTLEAIVSNTDEIFAATIRWKNALLASEQRAWMHLMSFVLVWEANDWKILLAQVTAVDFSSFRQAGGKGSAG